MTEIVGKNFKIISMEVAIIPKNMIVTGTRGSLDAFMRNKVEISFSWMIDALVHNSACQHISILVFIIICREEPVIEV